MADHPTAWRAEILAQLEKKYGTPAQAAASGMAVLGLFDHLAQEIHEAELDQAALGKANRDIVALTAERDAIAEALRERKLDEKYRKLAAEVDRLGAENLRLAGKADDFAGRALKAEDALLAAQEETGRVKHALVDEQRRTARAIRERNDAWAANGDLGVLTVETLATLDRERVQHRLLSVLRDIAITAERDRGFHDELDLLAMAAKIDAAVAGAPPAAPPQPLPTLPTPEEVEAACFDDVDGLLYDEPADGPLRTARRASIARILEYLAKRRGA